MENPKYTLKQKPLYNEPRYIGQPTSTSLHSPISFHLHPHPPQENPYTLKTNLSIIFILFETILIPISRRCSFYQTHNYHSIIILFKNLLNHQLSSQYSNYPPDPINDFVSQLFPRIRIQNPTYCKWLICHESVLICIFFLALHFFLLQFICK